MVVLHRSAGIRGIRWRVHLEIASGSAVELVGVADLVGAEFCSTARHSQNHGLEGRQPVASNKAGGLVLWNQFPAHLRWGIIFGDAAPLAGASD